MAVRGLRRGEDNRNMRTTASLLCLLIAGCTVQQATPTGKGRPVPVGPAVAAAGEAPPAVPAKLQTRKAGSDWPGFLGPLGTSVSTEKGIITPWPNEGLRVVWHKRVGTGYGMPSISQGRLFQFDRHGDDARLTCLNSETGDFLWKFDYPTSYEDYYRYNNGPRCCPV